MDLFFSLEWLRFLVKAVFGTTLFTLILWCAQSRNPRAAGMMLTFPALNGIGLLTAETDNLFLMAQAMPPMILCNGILCVAYIILQRRLAASARRLPPLLQHLGLLGLCLLMWAGVAFWVAPWMQGYLASSWRMLTLVGVYALCSLPVSALILWRSTAPQDLVRLSFRQVLRANAVRVAGMFVCIALVMFVAHHGAAAWAGRLSTLPLLPFYSLLALSATSPRAPRYPSRLEQLGSTVLYGPLLAIVFVWAVAHYLHAIRAVQTTVATAGLALLGLLALWGLCGLCIWGLLWVLQRWESHARPQTVSQDTH